MDQIAFEKKDHTHISAALIIHIAVIHVVCRIVEIVQTLIEQMQQTAVRKDIISILTIRSSSILVRADIGLNHMNMTENSAKMLPLMVSIF